MGNRNVYFFTIQLIKSADCSICTKNEFVIIFKDILKNHTIDSNGIKSIDLTEYSDNLHTSADYITQTDNSVFMRLCKQKLRTGLSKRDYVENTVDDVIPGTNESRNGIEACTYAYINYEPCIMEIVSAQTAPKETVLRRFFTIYNKDYYVDLLPIPNPHSLESLYKSNNPKIKKLQLDVAIPNLNLLSDLLGWNDKEIESLVINGGLKASVCLQPENNNRGSYICSNEDSRKMIDIIRSKGRAKYKKASLSGNEDKENLRQYNFFDDNFSFPLPITDYKKSNGDVISFDTIQLLNTYKKKMILLYNENYGYFKNYLPEE